MKNIACKFFVLFMVFGATACAPKISADVTRFADPQFLQSRGASVHVMPSSLPQAQSLEYNRYAGLIEQALSRQGFTPVNANADYNVYFDYGMDNGQTVYDIDPYYGSVGVGTYRGEVGLGGSIGFPLGGRYGARDATYFRDVVYDRYLELTMENTQTNRRIFEGRVTSRGTSNNLPQVMPCLIAALFRNAQASGDASFDITLNQETCAGPSPEREPLAPRNTL